MKQSNFAEGYNVLTGEVINDHPENKKYSEIHTGDAWRPARNRYCQNTMDMSVALVVFLDKTHTDLHGALSLTPVIFTLTLFNRASRMNPNFGGHWDTFLIYPMEKADQVHIDISNIIWRQSERDFPRGSMRNGLINGTKCQSSERKGNLFQLLCIAHTSSRGSVLKRSLKLNGSRWK
jgi:hypothetical protein